MVVRICQRGRVEPKIFISINTFETLHSPNGAFSSRILIRGQTYCPTRSNLFLEIVAYSCTSRRRFSWTAVCALSLGLAVFLWGTRYKLSLYFQPSDSHSRVAMAKLLSHESTSSWSATAGSTDVKTKHCTTSCGFSFLTTTHASLLAQAIWRVDEPRGYASPAQNASFIHFSSRPPPAPPSLTSSL